MDELKYYFGGQMKAISDTESEGYLVSFTDESQRDLHNQWFSKRTEFLLDVSPIVGKMVLYNHGMHPNIGTIPTGKITHAELRDDGIFVRKTDSFKQNFATYAKNRANIQTLKPAKEFLDEFLDDVDKYEKMLQDLRSEGLFKFSSGALPQSVQYDEDTGEILKWQIIEGSETGTPAEQRGLTRIHSGKSFKLLEVPYYIPQSKGVYSFMLLNKTGNTDSDLQEPKAIERPDMSEASKLSDASISEVNTMSDNEKMLDDETRGEIRDMVRQMMEESNNQASEAEPTKAEDDEEEIEDNEKSVRDIAKAIFAEQQAQVEAEHAQKQAQQTERESFKADILKEMKSEFGEMSVGTYAREQVGTKTSSKTPFISVAEQNEFRGLSAMEMALGVKLAMAKVPEYEHAGFDLTRVFSDGYIKSMAHKMVLETESLGAINPRDTLAVADRMDMKNAFPFKANELNASDISGQGADWVTIWYDPRLWDRVREDIQLLGLMTARGMRTVEIPQGSESMTVMLRTGSGTVYTGREANSGNATGGAETVVDFEPFTTSSVNQTLSIHTLAYAITYQLTQRSIIEVVASTNDDMIQTLGEALEDAMINGDTTLTTANINTDATPATTTYGQTPLYTAWDGIRHAYLVDNTARATDGADAALSAVDFKNTLQNFDNQFRNRKSQMLFLMDTDTEYALLALPEVLTRDVAGDQQTLFTGKTPNMFGVNVYSSGFFPNTDTSGGGTITSTGSGTSPNTLGGFACVYAPFWQYGRQQAITIETSRIPRAMSTEMVATVSHAFRRRGDNAAAGRYDVTVV